MTTTLIIVVAVILVILALLPFLYRTFIRKIHSNEELPDLRQKALF